MSFLGRSGPSAQEVARESYIKKNITVTLGLALKTLQQKHVNSEEPIYSEDTANTVCNILEAVFLHGLKSSFTHKLSSYLIGVDASRSPQPSFWQLLTKFSHKDVLSQLNHLGQITTEIGMCRAWIRVALNDGVLESYLDAMMADKATIRYFYRRTAYLRDEEQAGILKSYIQGVLNFKFQLSYNSSVLNIWTTTPLLLAGLIEQNTTPRAAMVASQSESALSQMGNASSPEASVDTEPIVATGHRTHRTKASEPRIASSTSYNENLLQGGVTSPHPPNNTPYNSSMLTCTDIDEIRRLTEQIKSSGSASTPTSQISIPDYAVEGRFIMSPDGASGSGSPSRSLSRSPKSRSPMSRSPMSRSPMSKSPMSGRGKGGFQEGGSSREGSALDGRIVEEQEDESCAEDIETDGTSLDSANREVSGRVTHIDSPRTSVEAISSSDSEMENNSESSEQIQNQSTPIESPGPSSSQAQRPTHIGLSNRQVPLAFGKSTPLRPVMSDATVKVEVAREVSPSMVLSSESEENVVQDTEEECNFYDKYTPSPKSNALGLMEGWSSEFQEPEPPPEAVSEESPAEISMQSEQNIVSSTQVESYNALIRDYPAGPVEVPTMREVLDQLPDSPDAAVEVYNRRNTQPSPSPEEEVDYPEDYEVLPVGLNVTSSQADVRTQLLVGLIGNICNEKGLDQQNYQCNACSRPVGMIYGKARVCTFDGCYYCYECHENEESVIPSRIVHNWDFTKHKVACHTAQFLRQVEEEPLLNIQHINPRLYDHVADIKEIRELRTQLRYLKAYLFTCKQSTADDLRKQVWPKEYLYDDIHLYSLQDLLQIQSGQLAAMLTKVIKFACKHVYDCRLCSQKGFICEICDSPKVIYPFQVETTFRCEQCNAVYHRDCKPSSKPCPKCLRRRVRQRSLGHHHEVDYAFGPES